MINFILSLVVGTLPDTLYYTLALSSIKGVKNKRLTLFILIFIGYVLFNMLTRYNLRLYLLFDVYMYFILKILYKSEVNDFFLVIFSDCYYMLTSTICFFVIHDYFLAFTISKILMFMLLLNTKINNKAYNLYKSMWNRNRNKKMPIKSLTLRNSSLLAFNITIIIFYVVLLFITKAIG